MVINKLSGEAGIHTFPEPLLRRHGDGSEGDLQKQSHVESF